MEQPGRNVGQDYSYGNNGMINDNEMYDGAQDFGAREYDNRLGRWWAVDPHSSTYPSWSPYHFAANSPILIYDKDGRDWGISITKDANGNKILNITFTGAVVVTAQTKQTAADISKTIASSIKQMLSNTAAYNGIIINPVIDIRGITSIDEIKPTDHVIEIVDDELLGSAAGFTPLYGKHVHIGLHTIDESTPSPGGFVNNKKTIAHEIFHSAGLRHTQNEEKFKEDDYDFPLEMGQMHREPQGNTLDGGLYQNLMVHNISYEQQSIDQILNMLQLGVVLTNFNKGYLNHDNVDKVGIKKRLSEKANNVSGKDKTPLKQSGRAQSARYLED